VIDVTDYWDKKIDSIMAYGSQFFNPDWKEDEPQTYISSPNFVKIIEARAMEFGKTINATYAEGFTSKKILGVDDLFSLR
jgi:hypothetical protein